MKCPHCGKNHPDNSQFCPMTGQRLLQLKVCKNENCINFDKQILLLEAKFCPECGQPLADLTFVNAKDSILDCVVCGIPFKMILVEHGTFVMGTTFDQKGHYNDGYYNDDNPVARRVTLTEDYYIGETQVTQELWQSLMVRNPSHCKGYNNPVDNVSWNGCKKFIQKLNENTGKCFRLPTEAEWEFAARGGNKSKGYQYAGSDIINEVAWYDNNSSYKMHPVKTKRPNELGIYDMSGNVKEWCEDSYTDLLSYNSNGHNPHPGYDYYYSARVLRGGNCMESEKKCRVYARDFGRIKFTSMWRLFDDLADSIDSTHDYGHGLRLVLSK